MNEKMKQNKGGKEMKHYIIGLIALGVLSLTLTTPSYADRITHQLSGLCVHPLGRPNNPVNNTRLVLYDADCRSTDSRLEFALKNNHLVHLASGKCVHPLGGYYNPSNNTELVLYDGCNDDRTKFVQLPSGQIQHVSSGKCVHPKGGHLQPSNQTRLVLYEGCYGKRLQFSIAPIDRTLNNTVTTKLFHSRSGKCVRPENKPTHVTNDTSLVFHSGDCDSDDSRLYFTMLPNGAIQHIMSGKCIHIFRDSLYAEDYTPLVLYDGCTKRSAQFQILPSGAIQQKSTGKCIRPFKNLLQPINKELLVLHGQCNGDGFRMKFLK